MFCKLFSRLFRCIVALIGVIVLFGSIAGFLAIHEPAFYADLRSQKFSKEDQTAAKDFLQHMERDFRLWSLRSLALQRAQISDSATPAPNILFATPSGYDPVADTHSLSITEKHINAQFASEKVGGS
jgi:hypothetical protein